MILESSLADLSLTFHSLLMQIILYSAFCRAKYDYKEENKEESADPEDHAFSKTSYTALQAHLAEPMTTH